VSPEPLPPCNSELFCGVPFQLSPAGIVASEPDSRPRRTGKSCYRYNRVIYVPPNYWAEPLGTTAS
jgi:hypothetical protein